VTEAPTKPTPTSEVSRYPYYATAEAYLKNFLGRGRRHYFKTSRYALYRYSATMDVIVSRLAPHIYEVKAYPPAALNVGSIEEALTIQPFRAWIFTNDPRSHSLTYFWGSQRDGLEHYKLVAKAIRREGTLSKAQFYYRKLLASR